MNWLETLKSPFDHRIVGSFLLLAIALLLRVILRQAIIRNVPQPEVRLRLLINVRNGLVLLFLLGLAAIWAAELQAFALSVVALAAAFVLATKELIMCISGSILRTTGNLFSVGDRVEIGTYRGEVIDYNMFSTTLLEIGPGHSFHVHTGRTVSIPNSMLFNTSVINESALEAYVVHVFPIPVRIEDDWVRAERILLEAALAECGPFLDEAKENMQRLTGTHGFSAPSVEPRVTLRLIDPSRIELLVRIPAPAGRQGRLEQAILRRFLYDFYGNSAGA
jgi:small-conductance mechanosensitive channel